MILNSYAKLNLYLEVLNKRKDSYHNIKTVFERIGLADRITLKPRRDKKINLTCLFHLSGGKGLPKGQANLAYRSAKLLQDKFHIEQGVDIKLIKRIPVGAGLGGGSSNAACVLAGLNKLWRLNLSRERLTQLGAKIGSDVPFFLYDCPFALGEGRGERIKPLNSLKDVRLWHILAVPKIKVSTPFIYKAWDKNKKAQLTRPGHNVKILFQALKQNNFSLLGEALFNSLEPVTCFLHPEINSLKNKLSEIGVKSMLMSGSGPAIFGVVSSEKEAVLLGRQLQKNTFWRIFVVWTQ